MTIKYPFTRDGVRMFLDDTLSDIYHDLTEKTDLTDRALFITIGDKQIKIDMYAETFSELETFLKTLIDIEEE